MAAEPARALPDATSPAAVLADRLAAVLARQDPGWRLPRQTILARRYHVSAQQIGEAVRELVSRHIIRQLPDGQLYRASPADCLIPVPGVARLAAHVDPMGSQLNCRTRKVSWRRVPEDICRTLGLAPADTVCAVRSQWDSGGEPAAVSTTYLPAAVARRIADVCAIAAAVSPVPGGDQDGVPSLGVASALQLEMQPPQASVARALRLAGGRPAAMVTVRFDDPDTGRPVALTVAALRADLFRIVIDSGSREPAGPASTGRAGDCTAGGAGG